MDVSKFTESVDESLQGFDLAMSIVRERLTEGAEFKGVNELDTKVSMAQIVLLASLMTYRNLQLATVHDAAAKERCANYVQERFLSREVLKAIKLEPAGALIVTMYEDQICSKLPNLLSQGIRGSAGFNQAIVETVGEVMGIKLNKAQETLLTSVAEFVLKSTGTRE